MSFTLADMPLQTGRTAIVTGVNTGIGFEIARALAHKGARTAARSQHGLERMDQVKHAVLETDSGISIVPAEQKG